MIGKPKVRIAGAGALGLTTALALADAGCDVAVHDPADPGANASGVAAGMLAPAFESVLDPTSGGHFPLLLAARDLWPALAARAGVPLDRAGALWVGPAGQVQAHGRALVDLGLAPDPLSRAELRNRVQGLADGFEAGVYTDADWRLDAAQAIGALRRAAEAAGVVLHQGPVSDKAEGLLVVATGASHDLADLAPELSGLKPIKGHILRFAASPGSGPVVRGEGIYAAPSADGFVIGATMELGASDREVDAVKAAALAAAGARLFPALEGRPFIAATGVRAATADGLPMVGFSAAPDVLLAVGARRNGWLLAPLVAKIIVACVLGDDAGPWARRLAPERLALPI